MRAPRLRGGSIAASYIHLRYNGLDLYNKQHRLNRMQVINFSEARKNLKTVIDQVIDNADYTVNYPALNGGACCKTSQVDQGTKGVERH